MPVIALIDPQDHLILDHGVIIADNARLCPKVGGNF
jgi:hypothetical protein